VSAETSKSLPGSNGVALNADWWRRASGRAIRFVVGIAISLAAVPASSATTVALVVGSEAYAGNRIVGALDDARTLAAALEARNVDVTLLANASRHEWETAVRGFEAAAREADLALAAYAGHALQLGGSAFVVPVNVSLRTRSDLNRLPLLRTLLEATGGAARGVVLLDTCHESALAAGWGERGYGKTPVCADAETDLASSSETTTIVFGGSVAARGDDTGVDGERLLAAFGRRVVAGGEPGEALTGILSESAPRGKGARTPVLVGPAPGDLRFAVPRSPEASPSSSRGAAASETEPGTASGTASETAGGSERSNLDSSTDIARVDPPEEPAGPVARLVVNTRPRDARVRILNILPAYEAGMSLWANESYRVEVSHPDYPKVERLVRLGEEDLELEIRLDEAAVSEADDSVVLDDPPDGDDGRDIVEPDTATREESRERGPATSAVVRGTDQPLVPEAEPATRDDAAGSPTVPVVDASDLLRARAKFAAVRDAIERADTASFRALVPAGPNRERLLTLIGLYPQIDIEVLPAEASPDNLRIAAVLRIERLVDADGNFVEPAASFRDTAVISERSVDAPNRWSDVRWARAEASD